MTMPAVRKKSETTSGPVELPADSCIGGIYTDVQGAADFSWVSTACVRRWLTDGKLTRYKCVGRTLIRIDELRELVKIVLPGNTRTPKHIAKRTAKRIASAAETGSRRTLSA
jgi:hypothetical protein